METHQQQDPAVRRRAKPMTMLPPGGTYCPEKRGSPKALSTPPFKKVFCRILSVFAA